MENSNECRIRASDRFGQALDELTGGFLSHEVVPHPDLVAEEDGYSVAMHKYEASVPPGWEERVETTTIGKKI